MMVAVRGESDVDEIMGRASNSGDVGDTFVWTHLTYPTLRAVRYPLQDSLDLHLINKSTRNLNVIITSSLCILFNKPGTVVS